MHNRLIPSLLIPEIYFPYKEKDGISAYLIEKYTNGGFYKSFEISDIQKKEERKQIEQLVRSYEIQVTQWLPSFINRNNLNLSSIDSGLRDHSVRQIKNQLYLASECGVNSVAVISGQNPGLNDRDFAIEAMYESLCEICEEAIEYKINVLLEPIDYKTSKNGLLGSITSVSEMITRVQEKYKNIGLVFDTAHIALNEEEIFDALELTKSQIRGIHLSNAVLNRESDMYGDYHIPIGVPGFLTLEVIKQFLLKVNELLVEKVNVAIEVRSKENEDLLAIERKMKKHQEIYLN